MTHESCSGNKTATGWPCWCRVCLRAGPGKMIEPLENSTPTAQEILDLLLLVSREVTRLEREVKSLIEIVEPGSWEGGNSDAVVPK